MGGSNWRVGELSDDSESTDRLAADSYRHDRQVLVVGHGLSAVATAGFLSQTGLDPVIASAPRRGSSTGTVICWHTGLVLLERIGLRRPLERLGTTIDRLESLTDGRSWTSSKPEQPSLIALDSDRLETLLARYTTDRFRVADRAVSSLESTDTGVRATFARGVDEPFDAVVTTDRSLLPRREAVSAIGGVHYWEFPWPESRQEPAAAAEMWGERRAAMTVPVADGLRAQLVAAPEAAPPDPLSVADLGSAFGELFDCHDPFDAIDHGDLQYGRTLQAAPVQTVDDRIALVGPDRRALTPGCYLNTALGIEDAWVVADALAYGPRSTADAIEAFDRRRHRRDREIAAWLTAADHEPQPVSPWLRGLRAERTLAFSHLRDCLPALVASIPNRL